MILNVNFEELQALKSGAHAVLGEPDPSGPIVAAPPQERALVEALVTLLEGDISIETLSEQRETRIALATICNALRVEMDSVILQTHAAHEGAVAAYFDYAHSRAVLGRVEDIGSHMEALIELMTGAPATDQVARTFQFPD